MRWRLRRAPWVEGVGVAGLRTSESGLTRRDLIRTCLGVGGMAAVGGIIAACSPARPGASPTQAAGSTDTGGTPVKGGTAVSGIPGDYTGWNPALTQSGNSQALYVMFEGLLKTMPNGDLAPQLAEALPSISSDGVAYTFKLRPNVKWSDGTPLTVDDVVFTYQLAFDPKYEAQRSRVYQASDLASKIESIAATDDSTIVIRTKQPFASFLAIHGIRFIVPKHVLGDVPVEELHTHPFNQSPTAVTGPFKFQEFKRAEQLTLVRNDSYWQGPPYLD